MDKILRIRRLYRPLIGWRWYLQLGEWHESDGAVAIATGAGRRTFKVDWEEFYDTRIEAILGSRELGRRYQMEPK
jgi:hypothetical protein